ncbi:DNA cytosine methyltransferase [Kitasatospora purpeofusca]|uniref:DNA cytosine methyltransferase n=1 Tax=Kitasatospora purpeofusca TaxID=67352 RepID=UPI0022590E1F|nr:DNA cytosine methyltransferase [Kitasatospora purpeofusca]MCX4754289.1 DNA cytosine methyltransferase [Kitasatospora purpeofusca]WSR33721.1 DNA cytosine methyltransferase [Kitasatospora purpeofusca]
MLPDTTARHTGGGLRIASLCSGYGGLEMAVLGALDGQVVIGAEMDPFAARVFAHHHPGVPNLGDITTADWRTVRALYRPDVVVAGFPCTDISNTGPKAGIHGTRSGIWKNVAEAVRVLEPRIVFLENVAAILSRGIDVVAADLAQIGYDARWTCLRAGDPAVGAPHPRDRWFCVAHPADAHPDQFGRQWRTGHLAQAPGRDESAHPGHQAPASRLRLLPTPKASDGPHGGPNQRDTQGRYYLPGQAVRLDERWTAEDGTDYGPAIRRWEAVIGRPAPAPWALGPRGGRQLTARFTEWMMGAPDGHVTGLGLPRAQEIKILGNGVIPRQAACAYGQLLGAQQATPSTIPLAA